MLWHVCVFLHLLFSHKDSFELEFWIWIRVRSQSTLNLMEFSLRTLDKEALVDLSSLNNVIISPYILSKWWMLLYSRGQLKDCCIWLVKKKFQEADCGSAVSDGRQQCMRKTAKSMTRWHKRMVAGRIDWYTELECQRLERLYKEGQEESVPVKCGKTKRTSSLHDEDDEEKLVVLRVLVASRLLYLCVLRSRSSKLVLVSWWFAVHSWLARTTRRLRAKVISCLPKLSAPCWLVCRLAARMLSAWSYSSSYFVCFLACQNSGLSVTVCCTMNVRSVVESASHPCSCFLETHSWTEDHTILSHNFRLGVRGL